MRKPIVSVLVVVFILIAFTSSYSAGVSLPYTEDFSGVAEGDIPAGWQRSHPEWEVKNQKNAGGIEPEMVFSGKFEGEITQYRLITLLIDGASASGITLSSKQTIWPYESNYILRIQTSIDGGTTWQDQWLFPSDNCLRDEVFINLDSVADKEFMLSFVFDGDPLSIYRWGIDDICIFETRELDMQHPVGQGGVAPSVGKHNLPLNHEITLNALPPATWYAFDTCLPFMLNNYPFRFDPANLWSTTYIGTEIKIGKLFCHTWADGQWYAAVHQNGSNLYTINPENGLYTHIGWMASPIFYTMTYDEVNDILYAGTGEELYTVNRTTGKATLVNTFGDDLSFGNIAYGDGVLYVLYWGNIYAIDVETGVATLLGPTGIEGDYIRATLQYDKDRGRLFMMLNKSGLTQLAEIDKTNGKAVICSRFPQDIVMGGFAIPYGIDHAWEFDYWEVDGEFYSNDFMTTLVMDTDHSVQAFFTTSLPTNTLNMLSPAGTGGGAVIPMPGTHIYANGDLASITAIPAFDSVFDHWEVDGIIYSRSPEESLPIEDDHMVQAFFNLEQPVALPFAEDFSNLTGSIPVNWKRSHPCWYGSGGSDESYMTTGKSSRSTGPDKYRLVTPLLDASSAHKVMLTFKHGLDYGCTTTMNNVRIQTSTDGGVTWQDQWSCPTTRKVRIFELAAIQLEDVAGQEFVIAFVYDGDPDSGCSWYVDDVRVFEMHSLGVRLEMPEMVYPGDIFSVTGYLDNPSKPMKNVPTFFILEVFGKFWFWPSWRYFDNPEYGEIDYRSINVTTGTTVVSVILPFEWPDTGSDVVTGLGFYGAMLNPKMTDIMGEIAYQEWGYGASR